MVCIGYGVKSAGMKFDSLRELGLQQPGHF